MASIFKTVSASLYRKCLSSRSAICASHAKSISTSQKNKDGHTHSTDISKEPIPDFSKPLENKNWVSYGFNFQSESEDLNEMHNVAFMTISVVLVLGSFFFAYFPDFRERDWSQREAFLELRRREQLGLPRVDPNYVDPATIILPSDEELGKTEIII